MLIDEKALSLALGEKLQEYRQRKNFTLDDVVREAPLSISRSSLSAIEHGDQDISARDLFAMGRLLGFNMNDLFNEVIKDFASDKYSINLDR